MSERISVDEWALGIAAAVARRADCTRRQVAAILLSPDRHILATGYNGAPSGVPGCLTAGACPRGQLTHEQLPPDSPYVGVPISCIAIHAEENVLLRTSAEQRAGATMYVTHKPCPNCERILAGSGIAAVVWGLGAGERIDFS